jgi:FAD/FMN-containing dehydrogenase
MAEWRNWTGDQRCRPARIVRPRDRDELATAVAEGAESGGPVSVPGSGHSFTEAAMSDGTMIDVSALSGVLDADPATGLVRVAGGTVLADGKSVVLLGDRGREVHRHVVPLP